MNFDALRGLGIALLGCGVNFDALRGLGIALLGCGVNLMYWWLEVLRKLGLKGIFGGVEVLTWGASLFVTRIALLLESYPSSMGLKLCEPSPPN